MAWELDRLFILCCYVFVFVIILSQTFYFRNYIFISPTIHAQISHVESFPQALLIKLYKNKYSHNFVNNISATCFGFVSHLKAEYTIVL